MEKPPFRGGFLFYKHPEYQWHSLHSGCFFFTLHNKYIKTSF